MKSKKKSLRVLYGHVARRARERYDIDLSFERYMELSNKVRERSSDCVFLMKESNSRTHYLLEDQYIVVYHKGIGGICTFLPPEAIWSYI